MLMLPLTPDFAAASAFAFALRRFFFFSPLISFAADAADVFRHADADAATPFSPPLLSPFFAITPCLLRYYLLLIIIFFSRYVAITIRYFHVFSLLISLFR